MYKDQGAYHLSFFAIFYPVNYSIRNELANEL